MQLKKNNNNKNNSSYEYISLQDATKLCSYSQEYLSLRARRGKLKALKFGRNWVTKKEWLEEYLGKVEEYNNHVNGRIAAKQSVLPSAPDNLPIEKFKLNLNFGELKPAFALALVFVLIMAGGVFGKENLLKTYNNVLKYAEKASQNMEMASQDVLLASLHYKNGLASVSSVVAEYISWLEDNYFAADNFVSQQIVQGVENIKKNYPTADQFKVPNVPRIVLGKYRTANSFFEQKVNQIVRETINSYTAADNFIDQQIAQRVESIDRSYSAVDNFTEQKITQGTQGIIDGYAAADNFIEQQIVLGVRNIGQSYTAADNLVEKKVLEIAKGTASNFEEGIDMVMAEAREIRKKATETRQGARDLTVGTKTKISNFIKGSYRFVALPWRGVIPEGLLIKEEEFEKLKTKMEEFEKEPVVIKRIEVEKRVEPVKEITREIETVKQVTKIDDEALKQVRANMVYLEGEIGKRLYAPGGVVSQTIYVTEPVSSPKVYQENGEIVLQTLGSGNVILSAATGLQLYGQQVVIESTNALNPLIYLADPTRIGGAVTVTGDLTVGNINAAKITGTTLTGSTLSVSGSISATSATSTFGGIETTGLKMTTGATNSYVLTSNASGYATWQAAAGGGSTNWIVSGTTMYSTSTATTIGISTTSPRYLLDVWGDLAVGTSTVIGTGQVPALYVDSGDGGRIGIGTTTLAGLLTVGTTTPALVVSQNGNVFLAQSSGSIGIGTTTPEESKLRIAEPTAPAGSVRFDFSGTAMGILQFIGWANGWNMQTMTDGENLYINRDAGANSNVLIGRGPGNELFIEGATNNVGIATSSPRYRLDVWGDLAVGTSTGVGAPMNYPLLYANSGEGGSSNGVGIGTTTLAGLLTVGTTTPALVVGPQGYVAIGTTTPFGLFSVGTTTPAFYVTNAGLIGFNGVSYSWPSSQGGASTVLTNDSSGNLSWAAAAGGSNTWDWIISGTTMYSTSTATTIGISTTTPRYTLDVWGDLVVGTSTGVGAPMNYPLLYVNSGEGGSSNGVGIGTTTLAGLLTVGTTTAALVVVAPDGSVGIGTDVPKYTLDTIGTGRFFTTFTKNATTTALTVIQAGPGNLADFKAHLPGATNLAIKTSANELSTILLPKSSLQFNFKSSVTWTAKTAWNAPNVGVTATPAFADLDNDGDYDLLIGLTGGTSNAYENTGSAFSPIWTAKTAWNAPDAGIYAAPAFADLDNDGDYDLLVGELNGVSYAYENTGSASSPTWAAKTAWDTPNAGGYTKPAFADLDNDGDYDLLIGDLQGISLGYRNTGSASSPTWAARTAWNSPDTGDETGPIFADLDNDGDYDLLNGDNNGVSYAYENTGSASSPIWTAKTAWNAPDIGTGAMPALADLDNDGDYDLLVLDYLGASYAYENTGSNTSVFLGANGNVGIATTSPSALLTIWPSSTLGTTPLLRIATSTTESLYISTSGDLGVATTSPRYKLDVWGDFAVGTSTDTNTPLIFADTGTGLGRVGIGTTTLSGLLTVGTTTPSLVVAPNGYVGVGMTGPNYTLDISGKSRIWTTASSTPASSTAFTISQAGTGNMADFKAHLPGATNLAIKTSANELSTILLPKSSLQFNFKSSVAWTAKTAWNAPDVGADAAPALADLDNDGDYDLLIGENNTSKSYAYENTGSASSPTWAAKTAWDTPNVSIFSNPAFADLDNDGDYDLLIGAWAGTSLGYENTGSASSPTWAAKTVWNVADVGNYARPAFADLDNDGDYDLLIGETLGTSYGYENTGSVSSPTWTAKTAWNTADVGDKARPAFADLDNDGDYDLLIGENIGVSLGYENTGSVSSPTWTAKTAWNSPDTGDETGPIFADLDNDGDYDLLIGENWGVSFGYENTGSNTSVFLGTNGSVGIATTSPSALLTIWPSSTLGTTPLLRIATSTTESLYISTSGDLGVATTSPRYKLDVWGDFAVGTSTAAGTGQVPALYIDSGEGGRVGIGTTTLAGLFTVGTSTPMLVVDPAGNIGIASSTPSYLFSVQGRGFFSATTTIASDLVVTGAMKNVATKIVAATSTQNYNARADYVCAGASCEDEIESAFAALPSGGGVVYLLEGTYPIGAAIDFSVASTTLIGAGSATVLERTGDNFTMINTGGYSGIVIANLRIDGKKATYTNTNNHGIVFAGSHKLKIQNTWIHDNAGRGIDSSSPYTAADIIIDGNYIYSNTGDGIYINLVTGYITISNNHITSNGSDGIEFNSGSEAVISNNTIRSNGSDGIIIQNGPDNDVTIIGNYIVSNSSDGVQVRACVNCTISGNTIISNTTYGIYVDDETDYSMISGNNIANHGTAGIYLDSSTGNLLYNSIVGNQLFNNGSYGIRLSRNADGTLISSNRIHDSSGTYGIEVANSNSDDTYIVGNEVTGTWTGLINNLGTNTVYGAQLYGASASTASLILSPLGNIGIATTSPRYKLDVWGDFAVGTSTGVGAPMNYPLLYVNSGEGGSSGGVGIGTTTLAGLLTVGTTTPSLVVNAAGKVGIGRIPTGDDTSYALVIQGAACIDDTTANCPASPTDGTWYVENADSLFDIAEYYPSSEPVGAGDVVMTDSSLSQTIKKSIKPYDQKLIGIVSTNPALAFEENTLTLGQGAGESADALKPMVTLVGRVFVKVSIEAGPIAIGDALTSSNIPGVAMKATKAGRVIGMALESFNESSSSTDGIGKVMVFVNLHWQGNDLAVQQNGSDQIVQIDVKSELADLGLIVNDYGVLEVQRLKTQELEVQNGITIFDRITQEPYCVFIAGGAMQTAAGKCGPFNPNAVNIDPNATNTEAICQLGQNQACGTEVGACQIGVQVCENGQWGACLGAIFPTEEMFDEVDNNCDGQIDEGLSSAPIVEIEPIVEPDTSTSTDGTSTSTDGPATSTSNIE